MTAHAADHQQTEQDEERPENARRHSQQHGERHAPALVKSCQAEEYEDNRKGQDLAGGTGGLFLLAGLTGPFNSETAAGLLLHHFLHGSHGLTGAVTLRCNAIDADAAHPVETGDDGSGG